jgi:pimeloyl-ACP methyl ester carboxylesterase
MNIQFCDRSEATYTEHNFKSLAVSYITLLKHVFYDLRMRFSSMSEELYALSHTDGRKLSKKRLIVCLHGLNNSPRHFAHLFAELKKENLSGTDIYIPPILEKGGAALDDMVQPIFEVIAKWAKTRGKKSLVFVGISNGARIARAVEAKLALSPVASKIEKLHTISIVGAWNGSSLANLASLFSIPNVIVSKHITREMPTDSPRIAQLDRDWKQATAASPHIQREYTFFAAAHDWTVPNITSTLADVAPYKARYALIPSHGHNSIVNAISSAVAKLLFLS